MQLGAVGLALVWSAGCMLDRGGRLEVEEGGAGVGGAAGTEDVVSAGGSSSSVMNDCGDGVVDTGEDCDGDDLGGATCVSKGFESGQLSCHGTCLFDTSDCGGAECGDGAAQGDEPCDGDDFGMATCQSQGFAAGELACAQCQIVDGGCVEHYTQDFEGIISLPSGWTGNWYPTVTQAHTGSQSARSALIGNDQDSALTITLEYEVPGEISFWYRVSSEATFDFLRFYVDGALTAEWSGLEDWTQAKFSVAAGSHTFSWVYEKDYATIGGSDAAWVDDVVATNGYAP